MLRSTVEACAIGHRRRWKRAERYARSAELSSLREASMAGSKEVIMVRVYASEARILSTSSSFIRCRVDGSGQTLVGLKAQ